MKVKMDFISHALKDISAALRMYKLWIALAMETVTDQHRKTFLGPIWLILNYMIYIAVFIFIFHSSQRHSSYPAYVATGMFVWQSLTAAITKSSEIFFRSTGFIRGTTLPSFVYIMVSAADSVIEMGYKLVGLLIVLTMVGVFPSPIWVWSVLGIFLITATIPGIATILAFIGAYFPDMKFVIQNIIRIGLFLTPIFWVKAGGAREILYYVNPFTYYLELVRAPIVDGVFPAHAFMLCSIIFVASWIIAVVLLGNLNKQLAFIL